MPACLKRLITIACLTVVVPIAGCGDSGESDSASTGPVHAFKKGTTMAKIQDRGKLRVGIKLDAPLFGLKDPRTDSVTGFDADLARLIARDLLGKSDKVEFIEASSKNRELFLQQDRVDVVLATYSITPERKRVIDFAGPYYEAGKTLLVRKDTSDISGLSSLPKRTVCTAEGTTDEELLRKEVPEAKVVVFDTWSLCAEALRDQRADAIISDNTVLYGLMKASPDTFKLAGKPFTEDKYGIGIRKGDDGFNRYLNSLLTRLERDGEWRKAYEETVGEVAPDVPKPPSIENASKGSS